MSKNSYKNEPEVLCQKFQKLIILKFFLSNVEKFFLIICDCKVLKFAQDLKNYYFPKIHVIFFEAYLGKPTDFSKIC